MTAITEVWTPELEAAHRQLSPHDLEFRRLAAADHRLLRRETFSALDRKDSPFAYRLQSWPTFLSAGMSAEMARASVAIADLIKSLPERVFGNDPRRISDFFGIGSPDKVSLALAEPTGIPGGTGRGDFMLTDQGLRCIEFNLCSSLGGWETPLIAELLLAVPEIADFVAALPVPARPVNTIRTLFLHAIREALELGVADRHVVFAIGYVPPQELVGRTRLLAAREFRAALEEVDPSLDGEILFCDYRGAGLEGGALRYRGRTIHCLLEQHMEVTHPLAFRAQKMGRLVLYNGPVSDVLSDKRNIALLSGLLEGDLLEADERRLVESYVPWTRQVVEGRVEWQGAGHPLPDLLRARRERMVLKKAVSLGGKDVALGHACSAAQWSAAVDAALADGGWIVQEYAESRPYLFQDGEEGCVPCDVVWGPFIFGQSYGGTILRLQPRQWGDAVNLSKGASEGIIFELGEEG